MEVAALKELRRMVRVAGKDLHEAFRATVGHNG